MEQSECASFSVSVCVLYMEIGIYAFDSAHTHALRLKLSECVNVRLELYVCAYVCVSDLIRNITSFVFKDVFKCESL